MQLRTVLRANGKLTNIVFVTGREGVMDGGTERTPTFNPHIKEHPNICCFPSKISPIILQIGLAVSAAADAEFLFVGLEPNEV